MKLLEGSLEEVLFGLMILIGEYAKNGGEVGDEIVKNALKEELEKAYNQGYDTSQRYWNIEWGKFYWALEAVHGQTPRQLFEDYQALTETKNDLPKKEVP